MTIDAGSSLVADTGLTGLAAGAGAQATIEVAGIDAGITLGLIATEDEADINPDDNGVDEDAPGPGDRFYIRTDGPVLSVDEVALNGHLDMVGRLGFLEVGAVAVGHPDQPRRRPGARREPARPRPVSPSAPHTDADATLVRDLLRNFSPDVHRRASTWSSTDRSRHLLGARRVPRRHDRRHWDLADPAPTVDPDLDFQQNLLPFEGEASLTHDGAADADETLFTRPGAGSSPCLASSGPSSSIRAPSVCTITSIVSDTTLRCENPEPDDGDPDTAVDQNPITFDDGVEYRVAGNTLAYLVEILDAIDGLADYLEDAVGDDAFAEPLPIVGVTPAEIVDQIAASCATWSTSSAACRTARSPAACRATRPRTSAPSRSSRAPRRSPATPSAPSPPRDVRWRITGNGQDDDVGGRRRRHGRPGAGDRTLTLQAPGAARPRRLRRARRGLHHRGRVDRGHRAAERPPCRRARPRACSRSPSRSARCSGCPTAP